MVKRKAKIMVHQVAPAEPMEVEFEVVFTPEQDKRSEGEPSLYAEVNLE